MPYFAWALIGALFALPLICFNNCITHRPLVARTVLDASSLWAILNRTFGITIGGPLGNLALWFVRSLMMLFLLFPLWHLIGKLSGTLLILLGLAGIFATPETVIPILSVKFGSLGYFLLGMGLALKNWGDFRFQKLHFGIFALLYFSLIALQTPAYHLLPFVGILFWVSVYDCFRGDTWHIPQGLHKTFWIYCLHGSLVGYFTSGGLFLFGKSDCVSILLAVLAPIPTIALCVLAYTISNTLLPKTTKLLMGGR